MFKIKRVNTRSNITKSWLPLSVELKGKFRVNGKNQEYLNSPVYSTRDFKFYFIAAGKCYELKKDGTYVPFMEEGVLA